MAYLTETERTQLESLMKDCAESADARLAVAKLIQTYVTKDYVDKDLASLLCDIDTSYKPGDIPQYVKRAGAKAYTIALGGDVILTPPSNTTVNAVPKIEVAGVTTTKDQLRSGKYGTIMDFQRDAADALLWKKNQYLWAAITAAVTGGDNYTTADKTSASALESALQDMILYCQDSAPQGAIGIVGRATAVGLITKFTTFSNETKDEIRMKGVLGYYGGLPVIQLKKMKDNVDTLAISNSDILIVGKGALKNPVLKSIEVREDVDALKAGGGQWSIVTEEQYDVLVYDSSYISRVALV